MLSRPLFCFMPLKIIVTGKSDAEMIAAVQARAQAANLAAAEAFKAKDQELMAIPGEGRMYPSRRGDGTMHQASAPGQAPARDTGELADSIEIDDSENVGLVSRVKVGWTGEEALIAQVLNDGRADGHIAPRPHFEESAVAGLIARDEAAKS